MKMIVRIILFVTLGMFIFSSQIYGQHYMSAGPTTISVKEHEEKNCFHCGSYDLGCNVGVYDIKIERWPIMADDKTTIIGYKFQKRKYLKGCKIVDENGRFVKADSQAPEILDEWVEYN